MAISYLRRLSLVSIVVGPVSVVSALQIYPYYEANRQTETHPIIPMYTVLDYPQHELSALPLSAPHLALERTQSTKKVASMPRVEVMNKDNSQEMPALDLSGLSPELAAHVELILSEPSRLEDGEQNDSRFIQLDTNGSQFSGHLPALNFQTHNYTSKQSTRWVKVNGSEVAVNEKITEQIRLIQINPRDVVIEYQGEKIQIPALYEWQG